MRIEIEIEIDWYFEESTTYCKTNNFTYLFLFKTLCKTENRFLTICYGVVYVLSRELTRFLASERVGYSLIDIDGQLFGRRWHGSGL